MEFFNSETLDIIQKNPLAILADFGEHSARAPVRMDSNLQKQCCTNFCKSFR